MTFEVADINQSMFDLLIAKRENDEKKPSARKILEQWVIIYFSNFNRGLKAIEYYTLFEKQFINSATSELEVEEINRTAFVRALLCLARLYYKLEPGNVKKKIEYLKSSLDEYKKVVKYCKEWKLGSEISQVELKVSEEMVALLPIELSRLSNELDN